MALICVNPTTYKLYVRGYLTVSKGVGTVFQGVGIGLSRTQTAIRSASAVEVLGASTATRLTQFLFSRSIGVGNALSGASPGVAWFGFIAAVSAALPANQCVVYCFTVTTNGTRTRAQVRAALSGARIGSDQVASTGLLTRRYLSILTGLAASDWCLLNNHFDRGIGNIALNAAAGFNSVGAPTSGRLLKAPASSSHWAQGQFKTGLRGSSNTTSANYNYCDTGFKRGLCGSFSVMWWMKQRFSPGTALSYAWGGIGNFRCFTNGVAGTTLWVRAWNSGSTFNIILPTVGSNIQVLARRTQGVCVALTVNAVTDRAQWYVDGAPKGAAIALPAATAGALVAASTRSFKIGKHTSNTRSSVYDLDEFKLCNFAMSAGTIRAWCARSQSHCTPYGNQCGVWLGCRGGVPRVGNSGYQHVVNGPPNMRFLFQIGVGSALPFDMGVAFPNLRGCQWFTRFDIGLVFATGASGNLVIPGGVPNSASLAGTKVDTQVLGFTGTATTWQSNAVRHAIELN